MLLNESVAFLANGRVHAPERWAPQPLIDCISIVRFLHLDGNKGVWGEYRMMDVRRGLPMREDKGIGDHTTSGVTLHQVRRNPFAFASRLMLLINVVGKRNSASLAVSKGQKN